MGAPKLSRNYRNAESESTPSPAQTNSIDEVTWSRIRSSKITELCLQLIGAPLLASIKCPRDVFAKPVPLRTLTQARQGPSSLVVAAEKSPHALALETF
jgi:hypothetical protein